MSQVMQVVPISDTTADIVAIKVKKRNQASKLTRNEKNVYWMLIPMDKNKRYDFKIKVVAKGSKHDLKVFFTKEHYMVKIKSELLRFGLQHYVNNK